MILKYLKNFIATQLGMTNSLLTGIAKIAGFIGAS
jgi:hypothetical protein